MNRPTQYEVAVATTAAPEPEHCFHCGAPLDHADDPGKAVLSRAGAFVVARMAEWSRQHRAVLGLVLLKFSADEQTIRKSSALLLLHQAAIARALRDADKIGLAAMLRGTNKP
ncbi:MAG: hypothetical protein NTY53_18595 [Kiritimatiellaeota bacterium]|nr:hypothetical protein [Kiritimatiellota bacterium]